MSAIDMQQRVRHRVEDLFWADEHELQLDEIVDRLGYTSEAALKSFCERQGLTALYQRSMHLSHVCGQQCPDDLPPRPDPLIWLGVRNRNIPPRDQRDWLTSVELTNEAGITYRQLDYWCRTNLMTPLGGDPTPGSGAARRFHETELQRIIAVRELLDLGMSLQVIRDVIDDFLGTGRIVVGGLVITRKENAA